MRNYVGVLHESTLKDRGRICCDLYIHLLRATNTYKSSALAFWFMGSRELINGLREICL
jgi:hypothetical protein